MIGSLGEHPQQIGPSRCKGMGVTFRYAHACLEKSPGDIGGYTYSLEFIGGESRNLNERYLGRSSYTKLLPVKSRSSISRISADSTERRFQPSWPCSKDRLEDGEARNYQCENTDGQSHAKRRRIPAILTVCLSSRSRHWRVERMTYSCAS
jgi:hypothetical protein